MNLSRYFLWLTPVLVISLLFIGCKGTKKGPDGMQNKGKAVTVTGVIVSPRDMDNKILTTGSVLANEEIELRSEVPGRIISINFEEGKPVRKGELLVKINDQELQAQLNKLYHDQSLAKDDVFRKQKLLEMQAVSQEEYDKATNQLGIVEDQMELIRSQIAKTEIYAPFSGLVGLRYVSPGGFLSSSTLIARLQQIDPVKIDFAIPEKYQEKIHPGSIIQFQVEGMDSTFSGRVYAIEPKIDPSTRNVSIRAICQNSRSILVPGAFAKVEVLLDKIPDAMIIPSEAIIPQINGEKVYLFKNGKAISQMIETGIRTDREVQVEKGLKANDTVITTGLLQIKEGIDVKIKIIPAK
jgi:membrane fusion protein (multidrug efflux system)